MDYTTSQINRDFLIVVTYFNELGKRIRTLIGVSTLIKMAGVVFANKFVNRAYNSMQDVCVCKLRRGVSFSFYSH